MVDPRIAQGNAQRRRMSPPGPTSSLSAIEEPNSDSHTASQYAQQGIKSKILDSPAAASDSNGVGAETPDFTQQLKDSAQPVTNQNQFSRPAAR